MRKWTKKAFLYKKIMIVQVFFFSQVHSVIPFFLFFFLPFFFSFSLLFFYLEFEHVADVE